jgi:hypothetical protein
MRSRYKIAMLVALTAFVGCVFGSTAWAAVSCCTVTCDPCPILVAKTVVASSPQKADSLHALVPAAFPLVLLTRASTFDRASARSPRLLPPEYRRPLRN